MRGVDIMPQTRIVLNLGKPSNSSFYDQRNSLHLTRTAPLGKCRVVTPSILMELRESPMPGLLDMDGKIDLKTGNWTEAALAEDAGIKQAAEDANLPPIMNTVDLSGQGASSTPDSTGSVSGDEKGKGIPGMKGKAAAKPVEVPPVVPIAPVEPDTGSTPPVTSVV